MKLFIKRLLNYQRINLYRTSSFKDLRSQAKDEEIKGKKYDSFKLTQKQQLHYLGQGLAFVNHQTTKLFLKDSQSPSPLTRGISKLSSN